MKNAENQTAGDNTESEAPAFDPVKLTQAMLRISEHSQKVMRDFIERHKESDAAVSPQELASISNAFMNMTQQLMQHPARMMEAGINLWQDTLRLWQGATLKILGAHTLPVIEPGKGDRRFQDKSWSENAVFDFIKQSYLLSSRWMQGVVKDTEGLDDTTRMKVDFYTRQFVDAMSPSNFVMTNPEVLRTTLETGGDNLVKGLENLLRDLERSHGALKIAMTDEKAFVVGKNIATTPGKVIFQNDLMQLIQYAPMTSEVYEKPLLIIPPWINKYYILDLGQKKSMVRWLAGQGYTVFMISWVNPDESLKDKNFEDYMVEGPMAALAEIRKATNVNEVSVVGYCIGGTLLASLLAYLEAAPEEKTKLPKISSATYFVTLLDFRDAGEISVFIDEENLKSMEEHMAAQGYFDGQTMAATFNMLRANDLIWSFVINNYLMGREPLPFDLLYWNADSTRMPAAMHSFYLREMYRKNNLAKPGGLQMKGVPIDLTKISMPAYFLSTREDHIAPWRSTYIGAQMMKGPVIFDLTSSGHIAGVVNPPAQSKYHHWVNPALAKTPEDWLKAAAPRDGSWWPSWEGWLRVYSGKKVPAREPGSGGVTTIEDAPGSYVRVRV